MDMDLLIFFLSSVNKTYIRTYSLYAEIGILQLHALFIAIHPSGYTEPVEKHLCKTKEKSARIPLLPLLQGTNASYNS